MDQPPETGTGRWGRLFSGLPETGSPDHALMLEFLDDHRSGALAALPWLAAEVAGHEGFETMLALVRKRGGRRLYLSADHDRCANTLGVAVGPRTHHRILESAVGSLVDVPSQWGVFLTLRRLAIDEALNAGASDADVARAFGVTSRALRKGRR